MTTIKHQVSELGQLQPNAAALNGLIITKLHPYLIQ